MLKASALDRVGPLEESYFWSFEDADWCTRARQAGLDLAVALTTDDSFVQRLR